jgi:hypothetical protein
MTNGLKSCVRLRKVTMPVSNAFFGKSWSTNLDKKLDLGGNVIFCQLEINYF